MTKVDRKLFAVLKHWRAHLEPVSASDPKAITKIATSMRATYALRDAYDEWAKWQANQ